MVGHSLYHKLLWLLCNRCGMTVQIKRKGKTKALHRISYVLHALAHAYASGGYGGYGGYGGGG
ncbi:MAG: hypothetical protein ABF491_12865, partial [Acetobacter sp.]|uniref:hypothetical protein n=1 Tax=Acetobacter sp. TaxID=440 RepID=UPI0039E95D4C